MTFERQENAKFSSCENVKTLLYLYKSTNIVCKFLKDTIYCEFDYKKQNIWYFMLFMLKERKEIG